MNIEETKKYIEAGKMDERFADVYADAGSVTYQRKRYIEALNQYQQFFGDTQVDIYSTPGRSEVCGNHTDHQKGKVIATSVNLDAIGVTAKTEDNVIRLKSGDFPMEEISLNDLEIDPAEQGTTRALIKGVVKGLKDRGYRIGGFTSYVTSDVLMGAGLSSSAAFEGLVGTILSGLYNDMSISGETIAIVSQYAENVYFGKPCGLMDQMACCVGGMINIDFADTDNILVNKIDTDFGKAGISLCIVDTKCSHADLTDDYAAIPQEMKQVANAYGKDYLRELSEEEFYAELSEKKSRFNGRALLRAIHFFEEEKRVDQAVKALSEEDFTAFLQVIKASGDSSAKYLQNIYSSKNPKSQNVTVALALSETILGGHGVCRVHGGGFAGTIQAFVEDSFVAQYKERIEQGFGENSCHVLKVRPYGGIRI